MNNFHVFFSSSDVPIDMVHSNCCLGCIFLSVDYNAAYILRVLATESVQVLLGPLTRHVDCICNSLHVSFSLKDIVQGKLYKLSGWISFAYVQQFIYFLFTKISYTIFQISETFV